MLIVLIVARQSHRLPPSVQVVFLAWSRLVFWLLTIFTDLHNRSIICQLYPSIVPTLAIDRPRPDARKYTCGATIIEHPSLFIERPSLLDLLQKKFML